MRRCVLQCLCVVLMLRRPPRSTRTYTICPCTSLFRSPNRPNARIRHIADPSLDGTLRRNTDLTARIEHDFTPDISNRLVLGWTTGRQKYEEIFGVLGWEEDPAASDADNRRRLSRALLITSSHADDYSIHNDLNVKFGLGGMEHQLSIGADYSHTVFKSTDLAGLVSSIDLYDPTYDAINKPEIIFTVYDNSSRQQLDRKSTRLNSSH